jgi:hypothetical protein
MQLQRVKRRSRTVGILQKFRCIRAATRALIAAPGPRLASLCHVRRMGYSNVWN